MPGGGGTGRIASKDGFRFSTSIVCEAPMRALLFAIGGFAYGTVLLAIVLSTPWSADNVKQVLFVLFTCPLPITWDSRLIIVMTPVAWGFLGLLLGLADWRAPRIHLLILVVVLYVQVARAAPTAWCINGWRFQLDWFMLARAWFESPVRLLLGATAYLIGQVFLWFTLIRAMRRSRAGIPPLRQLQFGLRSLLLLPLLLSVPLGIFVVEHRRVEQQRQAIEALGKLGASVNMGQSTDWWCVLFGNDFLGYADNVDASSAGAAFDDDALMYLQELPILNDLKVPDTKITDVGLARLPPFLRNLDLKNTRITDAGLKHLAKKKKLEHLDLSGCSVTDAGLDQLVALKSLYKLNLSQTQITDQGLQCLMGMPGLYELNLKGTQVTDEGVAKFQQAMPNTEVIR
jgi:hypothetical protein